AAAPCPAWRGCGWCRPSPRARARTPPPPPWRRGRSRGSRQQAAVISSSYRPPVEATLHQYISIRALALQPFPAGLAQLLQRAGLDRLWRVEDVIERAHHPRRRGIADLDPGALGFREEIRVLQRCRESILQRLEAIGGDAGRRDERTDEDEIAEQE